MKHTTQALECWGGQQVGQLVASLPGEEDEGTSAFSEVALDPELLSALLKLMIVDRHIRERHHKEQLQQAADASAAAAAAAAQPPPPPQGSCAGKRFRLSGGSPAPSGPR
ncbi:hypothetical protein HYH03_010939 [Edaphochlamys debaryana]|uniref:Uncharacterized protein n=1 Tax=Edaphochlamys debaryana TaxID=47281 RepID=A0A835XVG0_9CHLO|nr:hypothetical protein HYH03_010939 [Edaphochlamys debaryana]|eukprot:KAG2490545.1 hypothetical protein HYH03_010939 [Edaphochlamys debaryana]